MILHGALALCSVVASSGAIAHGFGERYDLPAPLGYFVAGAAATVALSFAVAILTVRRAGSEAQPAAAFALGARSGTLLLSRMIGVALLVLVLLAGAIGDPHPAKNLSPTLVWILGWVGVALLAALLVDPWPAIDPWRALHCWLDRKGAPSHPWPPAWGSKPAVAFFLFVAWLEVADPLAAQPSHLALLLLVWTVISLAGMRRFGSDAWRAHADPLAVYFATLGRFAPFAVDGRRLLIRPWARGLDGGAFPASVAFVIAMLATVLFDGLLGTQSWRFVDTWFAVAAPEWNDRDGVALSTLGLVVCFAVFFAGYRAACAASAVLGKGASARAVEVLFAPSLVPIAVAYLVAHNFAYILIQSQGALALASDPFGFGWNLFGTAGWTPDITLVGARANWYAATVAIVAGHVLSVWLAHRAALRAWIAPRRAIAASVPLTLVMIGYTAVSLTIIAEPITRYRAPDESYSRGRPLNQPMPPASGENPSPLSSSV